MKCYANGAAKMLGVILLVITICVMNATQKKDGRNLKKIAHAGKAIIAATGSSVRLKIVGG